AFLFASISFGIGLIFRSFITVYVQGFALLILWSISQNFTQEIENRTIAALLDPMGFRAFRILTEFWTPIERNTLIIGFTGEILYNRLLWVSVAALLFFVTYSMFSMNTEGITLRKRKRSKALEVDSTTTIISVIPEISKISYGFTTALKQYISLTRLYISSIIREKPFIAIALIAIMNFGINAYYANHSENTDLQPVTYLMIDTIRNVFTLYSIILSTLYAGELIWKERGIKLSQTFDALPVPVWVGLAGKLTALTVVNGILTVILIVGGMITQLFQGYTSFELTQYLQYLVLIALPSYLLLNILTLCIHVLVNQKYVGHMVVILFYIFTIVSGQLGFEHSMWDYATSRFGIYSDMNGWEPFYQRGFAYLIFFSCVGGIFAWIANYFMVRGSEDTWNIRIRQLTGRTSKPVVAFGSMAILCSVASGGFIYYNTNFLHTNLSSKQSELVSVNYEKTYARYRWTPQPKVSGLFINGELHPYEHWYTMSGVQTLVNHEDSPIDSLIVNYNQDLALNKLQFSRPLTLTLNDTTQGIKIYKFKTPLMPGDTMIVDFSVGYYKRGFPNSNFNTSIIDNGSFLYTTVAPSYGYNSEAEMNDPSDRKKYGLPEKVRIPSINDNRYKNVSYINEGSDLINFEAVVSTAPDQIAIAPGYLQREWKEQTPTGERRFFHYKMDKPIWNFIAILSGKYAVARDVWKSPEGKNVNIEIYYHPKHDFNIANFIESAKSGLTYYSKNFSPYQHSQYRVIEFPRYASFAQAFPNTIPFSESLEFIAKQSKDVNSDNIDFGFFVNAHELAHQWWAHQVLGSNQQGCTIMSESLAEYSALRVMEKKYGAEMTQKFLRYELDGYLRGRAFESRAEQPIAYNENQQYIHYNKGSHTFYCLADYIGEDTLNVALADFLKQWGGKYHPYPNSRDLLKVIRNHTPDSLQNVVTDLF
ncbi:MAG: ABC transporter permease, partial [Candidatus Kapabacteria bacterium]|nr:ABC transporter permease [Candidatus Kapabacteria bacterium]